MIPARFIRLLNASECKVELCAQGLYKETTKMSARRGLVAGSHALRLGQSCANVRVAWNVPPPALFN